MANQSQFPNSLASSNVWFSFTKSPKSKNIYFTVIFKSKKSKNIWEAGTNGCCCKPTLRKSFVLGSFMNEFTLSVMASYQLYWLNFPSRINKGLSYLMYMLMKPNTTAHTVFIKLKMFSVCRHEWHCVVFFCGGLMAPTWESAVLHHINHIWLTCSH